MNKLAIGSKPVQPVKRMRIVEMMTPTLPSVSYSLGIRPRVSFNHSSKRDSRLKHAKIRLACYGYGHDHVRGHGRDRDHGRVRGHTRLRGHGHDREWRLCGSVYGDREIAE